MGTGSFIGNSIINFTLTTKNNWVFNAIDISENNIKFSKSYFNPGNTKNTWVLQ